MDLKQTLSNITQKIKGIVPKKNKDPESFLDAESYMDDKPIIGDVDTSNITDLNDFYVDLNLDGSESGVFTDDGKVSDDFLSGLNLDSYDESDDLDGLEQTPDEKNGAKSHGKIPPFCKKIFDKIKKFFIEEKILAIVISSLSVFLIILLILLIALSVKSKKVVVEEQPSENQANLPYLYELPYEDVIDSYHFSREKKESWTLDEALPWFEVPDDDMIRELDKKNTKNINEILEAAP